MVRLRKWPDPAGSLADHPNHKILRRVRISEQRAIDLVRWKHTVDMGCHFDNRFSDQRYDNIYHLLSCVAQGRLMLGVIKALDVESV